MAWATEAGVRSCDLGKITLYRTGPKAAFIGRTDPMLLTEKVDGPRLLLLAGRSWKITLIDWKRRRCQVAPADSGGVATWRGAGGGGDHFEMTRAARDVLLGDDPPVSLTHRATRALAEIREDRTSTVRPGGTVIYRDHDDVRWWTWAGYQANATLAATLPDLLDTTQRFDDTSIRLRGDLTPEIWKAATADAAEQLRLPHVDDRALTGLKFTEALPHHLATATLAARLADPASAATVLATPVHFLSSA